MSRPCIAFGECMIELSVAADGIVRLGHAGDSYNFACYMARLGTAVSYATATGDDRLSAAMRAEWRAEGVGDDLALRVAGRQPGLYMIETDAAGERSFAYWREASAARAFFAHPGSDQVLEAMADARLLYLSLISLSLFPPADQRRLAEAARAARDRGAVVAFDSNYRAASWTSAAAAAAAVELVAPAVTVALPSLEDEARLFGWFDATECATRWRERGADEVVVKQGAAGADVWWAGGSGHVPAEPLARVVDTTGAGDSFNAGYLHARLLGVAPEPAAHHAAALAAHVIAHHGAIIPADSFRAAIKERAL